MDEHTEDTHREHHPTGAWDRLCSSAGADEGVALRPTGEFYCPDQPVEGTLRLTGSETMGQLAALWAHRFEKLHPQVEIRIECHGSETALPELTKDASNIGMISRIVTEEERQQFKRTLGTRLATIEVGHDVLATVVHPDNPVTQFSREQGSTFLARSADSGVAATWAELGASGEWSTVPISLHGYNEQSGTRTFLRRFLMAEETKQGIQEHSSHTALVEAVAKDRGGIGIVSFSRVRPDQVRIVPVAGSEGEAILPSDDQAVAEGRYPLVRPLVLVIPVSGDALQDPLRAEFVKYVLSRDGQADVAKDGFLPLHPGDLIMQRDRLGWNSAK